MSIPIEDEPEKSDEELKLDPNTTYLTEELVEDDASYFDSLDEDADMYDLGDDDKEELRDLY